MTSKIKSVAILLCAALASAGLAAIARADQSTLDTVQQRGTLMVGVAADYPPFSHTDQSGNIVGFDSDLAQYIADKLKVKLQVQPVTTGNRIPMLVNGNVDVVISSFTITREREEAVDFTIPYMSMGIAMLVQKGSAIKSYDDLDGRTVSFTQGTPFTQSVKKDHPNAKTLVFQDTAQGYLAVLNKKADAFLDDAAPLYNFATEHPDDVAVVEIEGTQSPMGLAVHENDSNWRDSLDFILIEAWEDGSYSKIYQKWFGAKPPEGFSIPAYRWYGWK
jgi:ABC-type amino acid transport substrate-binding protein